MTNHVKIAPPDALQMLSTAGIREEGAHWDRTPCPCTRDRHRRCRRPASRLRGTSLPGSAFACSHQPLAQHDDSQEHWPSITPVASVYELHAPEHLAGCTCRAGFTIGMTSPVSCAICVCRIQMQTCCLRSSSRRRSSSSADDVLPGHHGGGQRRRRPLPCVLLLLLACACDQGQVLSTAYGNARTPPTSNSNGCAAANPGKLTERPLSGL